MIKIGAAWCKTSKSQKQYISVSFAKELLPLTITDRQFLSLHLNENKTEDKHPDYHVCLSQAEDE